MPEYKAFAGFIQFDPNERETPSKQTLRDVVIQPIGYGSKEIPSVRVTVWPEHAGVNLSKGDFIAVQGKFTTANVKGKTYFNLSASQLAVLAAGEKAEAEVENPVEEEDDFDPGF